jgi:acyl transferase domain-containing protein/NADPH:quinone reductase-like Zn-dependent oxidoreductase/acyl carrier protein
VTLGFSRARRLARDGRCKFADRSADGFVRSEGVAVVVLKRLSSALADGDPIHAVLCGTAINNDGRSGPDLMAPSQAGQEALLRAAYRDAGIAPAQVTYVEAHGTGTPVGDPIELAALRAVLGERRAADRPLWIGSVKTNIGHTEGAAGLAGLIKAALILRQQRIPPCRPFDPTPQLAESAVLRVATSPVELPRGDVPIVAGVSSFGINGSNAHVVLEAAPEPAPTAAPEPSGFLLPLSATTPEALAEMVRRFRDALPAGPALHDICYTASVRRTHHRHRVAVAGATREALVAGLERAAERLAAQPRDREAGRIAFVFSGQGSQWLGMGRELLRREAVFASALEDCAAAIGRVAGWSLLEELLAEPERSQLERVDIVQPCLFAMQVALARLWRAWGIEPDAVVGHSMGEVAAAHVAGVLSLDDAARVICERSRLVRERSPRGAMAVVELPVEELRDRLRRYEGRVAIAAENAPSSTVVSGEPSDVENLCRSLESEEIFARLVKVDYASHGPQMDALLSELGRVLAGLRPERGTVPLYSTVVGDVVEGTSLDAAYWQRNLRSTVRFSAALSGLAATGHTLLVEITPHPVLLPAVRETFAEAGKPCEALASLQRDLGERLSLLSSLGRLYELGHPVAWRAVYPSGGRCVALPSYAWQHERFWPDEPAARRRPRAVAGGHPLLVGRFRSAVHTDTHFWEFDVDAASGDLAYLADHRVAGTPLLPAASYVELALSAAREVLGDGTPAIEDLSFVRPLLLDRERRMQVVLSPGLGGAARIRFLVADEQDATFALCAHGRVRMLPAEQEAPSDELRTADAPCADGDPPRFAEEYYAALAARSHDYGAAFRCIARVSRGGEDVLGEVRAPDAIAAQLGAYAFHPALLDACFQVLLAALPDADDAPWLPVVLRRLELRDTPSAELHCVARLHGNDGDDERDGDVLVRDAAGRLVAAVHGLRLRRSAPSTMERVRDSLYELRWEQRTDLSPADSAREDEQASGRWLLLIDPGPLARVLCATLAARGASYVVAEPGARFARVRQDHYRIRPGVAEDYARVLDAVCGMPPRPSCGIVHALGLGVPRASRTRAGVLRAACERTLLGVARLVQALSEHEGCLDGRLWLVSSRAQPAGTEAHETEPLQALLWGVGRVLALEHPELRPVRIDVHGLDDRTLAERLVTELLAGDGEDEIALRPDGRWIPRLVRAAATLELRRALPPAADDHAVQLEVARSAGSGVVRFVNAVRRAPREREVEIRVQAWGLNFRDALLATGVLSADGESALGLECAGTVVATGPSVREIEVGDEVVAVAPNVLATFVTVPADACVRKPAALGFAAAAALPVAYLTAEHALLRVGRLKAGERVLIHAAAGGVGLAALHVARRAGAEVFATAGSPEKRRFLHELGVEHVFDSRTLAFADDVMRATGGEGVDVILNSLAGDAVERGLAVLRPFGRFLELGKRDVHDDAHLPLAALRRNLGFHVIDLEPLIARHPDVCGARVAALLRDVEQGSLATLPVESFPLPDASGALQHLARAKHIGKVVLTGDDSARDAACELRAGSLAGEGAYLVTGGLGAIGLAVAEWLVAEGARHVALLGRRPPNTAAEEAIGRLRAAGATVQVLQADVASLNGMAAALAEVRRSAPLRGVIHAAGLLDDCMLAELDERSVAAVLAPKVDGAWNLHELTLDDPLEMFILTSSAAAVLGSPGQASYAAANAFLDALAHRRRELGLPALSVDFGPWADVGLAASRADSGARLAARGLASLSPEVCIEGLRAALAHGGAQVCVMSFARDRWTTAYPSAATCSLLRALASDDVRVPVGDGEPPLLRELTALHSPADRLELLEARVRESIADVLRMPDGEIERRTPLRDLGLDSLMAVELRNRLSAMLGLRLPVTLAFNHPTLESLTRHLAARLDGPNRAASDRRDARREPHEGTHASAPDAA